MAPLRVLLVEDSEKDALLLERALRKEWTALACERVDSAAAVGKALKEQTWDCVLCDMVLPGFGAPAALDIVKRNEPDLPFIIVSGVIGIEDAIGLMKAGAHDFVQKDYLARLVPAVRRELKDADVRRRHARAQEALRESEERFKSFADHSPAALFLRDLQGRYLMINKTGEDWHGASSEEMLGKTLYDVNPKEQADPMIASDREVVETGSVVEYEQESLLGDGTWHSVFTVKFPVRGEDGEVVAIGGIATDITEHRRAEEKLEESEKKSREILEHSPIGVTVVSHNRTDNRLTGNRLFVNSAFLQMFGIASREAAIKSNILDSWVDLDQLNAVEEIMKSGDELVDFEALRRRADGTEWWVSMNSRPIRFDDQDCTMVWHFDITERRRAEAALRESEARLHAVVENSPALIYLRDGEGRYVLTNKAFSKRHGIEHGSAIGKTPHDLVSKEAADGYLAHDRKVLESAAVASREAVLSYADGSVRTVLTNKFPVPGHDGKPAAVGVVSTDITERKRAEEAVKESEGRLRTLIDNSPYTITVRDTNGRYILVNKALSRLFGVEPDEIVGKTPYDFYPKETAEGFLVEDREVLRTGRTIPKEKELTYPNGETRSTVSTKFPLRGADDSIVGVCTIVTDITDIKNTEAQLRQAQKMEAVGQLTGGVAHEFNNLLQAASLNLELLGGKVGDSPDLSMFIGRNQELVRRGGALTRQLLAFSRKETLRPEVLQANDLVVETVGILRPTLGETIVIETSLAEGLEPIEVDRALLQNALLNVAINASHAMPGGGVLTLETVPIDVDEALPGLDGGLPAGRYVALTVSDTGCGMPPEVLERVFEPFFTTKGLAEGTGLGLSMVHGFARQSGGQAVIESEEGKGTSVRLYFPVAEGVVEEKQAETKAGDHRLPEKKSVLVVEDQEDVRTLLVMALTDLGFETHKAEDGPEALEVLDRVSGIDLLFTDFVLPGGMSGKELAREARRRDGGLKILLTSGYPEETLAKHRNPEEEEFDLVKKPYSINKLAQRMRAILEG